MAEADQMAPRVLYSVEMGTPCQDVFRSSTGDRRGRIGDRGCVVVVAWLAIKKPADNARGADMIRTFGEMVRHLDTHDLRLWSKLR
eukprot:4635913-Alexandrium_andersonii.AAC.1